jgi:hypothetical protein
MPNIEFVAFVLVCMFVNQKFVRFVIKNKYKVFQHFK